MGVNSKQKGSAFERLICRQLSLWISGGQHEDLLWRSAMSGGRATVGFKKGKELRVGGDICSVNPEGHVFTNRFHVECKFYKNLRLELFLLHSRGPLSDFWHQAYTEAFRHSREPMLIAKQNRLPVLLITQRGTFPTIARVMGCDGSAGVDYDVAIFDDALALKLPWSP